MDGWMAHGFEEAARALQALPRAGVDPARCMHDFGAHSNAPEGQRYRFVRCRGCFKSERRAIVVFGAEYEH